MLGWAWGFNLLFPCRPCPRVLPSQLPTAMAAYGQTQYSAGIQQAAPYTAYPPPAQAYGIPSYGECQTKPLVSSWGPQHHRLSSSPLSQLNSEW